MKVKLFAAALLAVALSGCSDAKQDKDAIHGEWAVVSAENGGKAISAGAVAQSWVTFAGDKFVFCYEGNVNAATFTLDAAKSPKQINLKDENGRLRLAIYELTGDDLKICLDESGKDRPSSFATSGGRNGMMVLKRKK